MNTIRQTSENIWSKHSPLNYSQITNAKETNGRKVAKLILENVFPIAVDSLES